MKERIIYLLMSVVLVAFSSCTKDDESKSPFDNVTYIEQAKVQDYDNVVFKKTITERQRFISAVSAYPVNQDVEVSFKVSPELATTYNNPQQHQVCSAVQESLHTFRHKGDDSGR